VLLPFVDGYTDEFWRYETNYEQARTVLGTIKKPLTINYAEGLPTDEQVAVLIRDGLRQAGLASVSLVKVPPVTFYARTFKGQVQAAVNSVTTPGIPAADYYFLLYGGKGGFFNFYKYSNPKLEEAIRKSTSAVVATRKAAAREGQRIFMEDLVFFPIAHTGNNHAVAPFLDIPISHVANGLIYWRDFRIV
jgi:ABC-type transport system substrate-binding protein